MKKILLSMVILGFTLTPAFATRQINYLAGHPVSVTYSNGVTKSINNFGSNAPGINYRTNREYYNAANRLPRHYANINSYQRQMAMTNSARRAYYSGVSRPVVVNNNIIVEPSKEDSKFTPVSEVKQPYTRSGVTYYN